MKRLYTIGQVSELTGINKRTLKYYIERDMISPSDKKVEGGKEYWLYSDSDIAKIRQIALYRELGYSADKIRKMIHSPQFDWREAIDTQIEELKAKKRHLENVIFAAEFMRYANEYEGNEIKFDISDFDNNIDQFAVNTFSTNEEELTEQSLKKLSDEMINGLNISDIQQQGQKIIEMIAKLGKAMDYEPDSVEVQRELSSIFLYFSGLSEKGDLNPIDLLFGIRLVRNLSMDRIFDVIFSKEGANDFLLKALQVYCNRMKKGEKNG